MSLLSWKLRYISGIQFVFAVVLCSVFSVCKTVLFNDLSQAVCIEEPQPKSITAFHLSSRSFLPAFLSLICMRDYLRQFSFVDNDP